MTVVDVFADVCCPFTHVGLRRLVQRRDAAGADVQLRVRAWPLELVNGTPLDGPFVAEEIVDLREQVAADCFVGFDVAAFPASSLPAMDLTAAGYARNVETGERVALAVRDALFEHGRDIADPVVLAAIATEAGLTDWEPASPSTSERWRDAVLADWEEGKARGVIGSPHFFVGAEDHFCPALHIERVDGHLRIDADEDVFEAFVQRVMT
ncbi:MAG: DsbA family protein [Actinomycetota bacterium]|nr:DsbA family protein [Actinomycetota bacterium]